MMLFINTTAVIFSLLAVYRIAHVTYACGKPETAKMIRLAEAMGKNPIGDMLGKPVFILLVCVVWLICQLF